MRAQRNRVCKAVTAIIDAQRGNGSGADLLARLLRSADPETGQTMSEELLTDNVLSFLMAGFDTTAVAMTWALYLLARSPEWEGRILEEVDRVVGPGPVTARHAKDLVVVQQVINEALRLYPTAPFMMRDILSDCEIDGVRIRAGTIGVIPIYAIHRHRSYWDDPDRFDPERFSPERPKPERHQFLPFGAGPRICIGAAFAMLEATIMIASFVRAARFEVEPTFDPQPCGRMILFPKNGMPMRVTPRGSH